MIYDWKWWFTISSIVIGVMSWFICLGYFAYKFVMWVIKLMGWGI